MNFDFLLAQAQVESGLDPAARAKTSSATGLFQFIDSTWLATVQKHGAAHGFGALASAIGTGPRGAFVADPALRQQILALRHDPALASLMAGALAQDNRAALAPVLGREPDAGELYLAHFLGANSARKFLSALQVDPARPAAALFPAQAAANRGIFYQPGGGARSLAEVMDLMRGKMARAMEAPVSAPGPVSPGSSAFSPWQSVQARFAETAQAFADRPRAMSALLGEAFGHTANDHVRRAYGRLRSAGL